MPADSPRRPVARLVNPPGLYDPSVHSYSQVAVVEPGARLVLISGQGGDTPDGPPPAGFEAQARQALRNVVTAVESVGGRREDVVKLTILIVGYDKARLDAYHAAQREVFGGHAPSGTLIPVAALALPDMLIEVEAMAAIAAD